MKQIELQIEDMTCSYCASSVQDALAEAGAQAITNVYKKSALVSFDENSVQLDDLKKAVEKAGYKVK